MSDLRLVGAVGIKVRPDTSKFRKETQQGINEQLGPQGDRVEAKTKVKVDADTTPAKNKIRTLEQEMDGKTFKLNVGLDHDSVQRAKNQVDRAMDSLKNPVIDFSMNRESLAAVRHELRDLAKKVRVKMEFDKDEAGYQSILNKIAHIRREQAGEISVPISFHTDQASLDKEERKAKEALARIEANKTVDIRYSDNYEGMKAAIADLDSRLEDIRKLKITTKLDEGSLEAARQDLVDMMQYADVTVRFNEDKAGYEKVLSRIREIQREKIEKEVTFNTDDEALRQEAAKYEQLIADANERAQIAAKFEPITLEYNEDLIGYQSIVDHIKKIQREKLVKKITFTTDEAELAAQLAKYEEAVRVHTPDRTVEIRYANDRDSLTSALKQVENEMRNNWDLKVPVGADTASLIAFHAKLQAMLDAAPLDVNFHPDQAGYESVLTKIKELRRQKLEQTISFKLDDASLASTEAEVKAKLKAHIQEIAVKFRTALDEKDLEEAKHQADQLKDHIDHMKASMKVELAGSELTAARLSFLGRDRVVNYITKVNERSMAVAEGMLKSLGGINAFSSVGKTLEGIFTKFDTYSLKATALASAMASVGSVFVSAGTAAFKIGEGVVQSLGLLAAAPAILGAATVGYTIFTAAFNNFFDAFNKDPKIAASSLAALPPIARKTVDSITGLYKGLANPVQEKFWKHVGSTLSDSIETLYPKLKVKLLESTEAVGDFVAGFGRSFNKLALSDDFDKMFAGFNGFFVNLSKGSEPFFDAWNKFGVSGSSLLPRFGQWLADLAIQFDNWATSLGKAGIADMINHGVESLQNMWNVGADVIDMFKGITSAAGLAGAGGLAQFEINLRKVADRMQSEPWQTKAATIFEGARGGASKLNEGFKDLTGTLGNSAVWLGNVLTLLGDIGGQTLTGLSDLFGSERYQLGITAELTGAKTLVDGLRPSFLHLGDVIGDMGKVAGAVFAGLGPVVNQLMDIIANVTKTLSDNLAAVAPKMLATVGGVLRVVAPLAQGVADAINGILDVAKLVPNSFVVMGVAAAAFFAMRGLASKFFDGFKQTGMFKNLESQWLTQQIAAGKTVDKYRMVNGEMQKFKVPTEKFSATTAGWGALTSGAGKLQTQFRDLNGVMQRMDGTTALSTKLQNLGTVAMPGVKKAAVGLLDFLGGGWGIGFMAASAFIGIFAQSQADAKQHVETLTAAIDKQTGAMSKAGLEDIAKQWTDVGQAGDGLANLNRHAAAANETAAKLKLNFADVTQLISQGGQPAKDLYDNLFRLGDAMNALNKGGTGGGVKDGIADLGQLRINADEAAKAFGLTSQELQDMGVSGADLLHIADNIKKGTDQADASRIIFAGLAKATGTSTIAAQQMATAMATIGDNSITAASKIGAINKALDLLKGGKMSAREAQAAAAGAQQNAVAQAQQLHDELQKNNHLFNDTTHLIDLNSTSGLKLYQTLEEGANGVKIAAQAAADASKSRGESVELQAAAAQKVVDGSAGKLEEIAKNAGVNRDLIAADWESFFGTEWQLKAVFTASADKFEAIKKGVEDSGLQWSEQVFKAFLDAGNDPAKMSVQEAQDWAIAYANKQYQAQLLAMNPAALAAILQATGQADNYAKGDYIAVMKALNSTDPGVQAAWRNLMAVKGGPNGAGWAAALKAYLDAASRVLTEQQLNTLARNREANILVKYSSGPGKPSITQVDGLNLNGSLTDARGRYPGGFRPGQFSVSSFANGGISVEKPGAAKIYSPVSQFRLFAEASTGGEAFIPMAVSKRQRSTQILGEVAKQFGLRLTTAQSFADGGIITKSRTGGSVAVHIGEYTQNTNDTTDDVARAIMRRVKNEGFYSPMEGF